MLFPFFLCVIPTPYLCYSLSIDIYCFETAAFLHVFRSQSLRMEPSKITQRVQVLLRKMVEESQSCTHSSHTISIYDIAWVSMVMKTVNEEPRWAFPESFFFLLDQQGSDGGWDGHDNSEDGILNTLAALLAMTRHEKSTNIAAPVADPDLHTRISKAFIYLQRKLQQWDVGACVPIGLWPRTSGTSRRTGRG